MRLSGKCAASLFAMVFCFATAATAQDIARLTNAEEVAELCKRSVPSRPAAHQEAAQDYLDRRYITTRQHFDLEVDRSALRDGEYLPDSGVLRFPLAAVAPSRVDAAWSLAFAKPEVLEFHVDAAAAESLASAIRTESVTLRVGFRLQAARSFAAALCTTNGEGAGQVPAELLTATFVDANGKIAAAFETRLGRNARLGASTAASTQLRLSAPAVVVSQFDVLEAAGASPGPVLREELRRARAMLSRGAFSCYVDGLARNGMLQGALVVQFRHDERPETRVLVDGLHVPSVSRCVSGQVDALAEERLPGVPDAASVKATLIFRLDPPSKL